MKEIVKKILGMFIVWKVFLFVFLSFAINNIALQNNFLGGGILNYLKSPHLWSWVNFDGEHYLSISFFGYKTLQYFYFPVYPVIAGIIASWFGSSFSTHAIVGILISHVSILLALLGLWKLVGLDHKRNIVFLTILLLLVFPTSFYFASFYTESFFLALVVWSFYFARQKKWFYASLLGAVASATKVVGIVLFPALVAEYFLGANQLSTILNNVRPFDRLRVNLALRVRPCKVMYLLLIPVGFIIYMIYLNQVTGDPLEFFHSVEIFGQQRSASFIMLPQVFYRYIFKILPNINYDYFPIVFTTWLEIIIAIVFGVLGILGFLKLRLSYAIYLALGYLTPTFSGSFSSLPRYVLVLFPAYILLSTYLSKLPRTVQIVVFAILFVSLGIATSLFVRAYWIS